jgi:hypothetical protein
LDNNAKLECALLCDESVQVQPMMALATSTWIIGVLFVLLTFFFARTFFRD